MRDSRRTRVVLGVLLAIAFALITVDARGGGGSPLNGLRDAGSAVFGPVERAAFAVADPVRNFFHDFGHTSSDRRRIAALQNELSATQNKLDSVGFDQSRTAEVDKLLKLTSAGGYKTVPAQVIAIGAAQGFSWTVTVDAGSRDGVKPNQTVLDGDGLVGRTTSVGPTTSTVLLACDAQSTTGVRLAGSMEIGLAHGNGSGPITVELLDPQASVKPGDAIVTFGSQGGTPFVPGVPFGVVTEVKPTPGALTRTVTVKTYVKFTALDVVGVVVQPPRTDPRDALVPPPTGAH